MSAEKSNDKTPSGGGGLAIGIAVGVALGAAMDNVGAGIAIGVAIGVAMGSAQRKKAPNTEGEDSDGSSKPPVK